jgi:Zn2+/Cd2+-exporting ATPase
MTTIPQTKRQPLPQRRFALDDKLIEPLFVGLTLAGILADIALVWAGVSEELLLIFRLLTYLFGGFYAVREIIAAARKRKIEVDLLMVLAALGAAYVGAWREGATLLFLFSLSNVLQHYAMQRTQQAISALLKLRPDTVLVRRDNAPVEVHIDNVNIGDLIILRPGDRIPLDGLIERGQGSFDEAALTGESLPVDKGPGDRVLAGTLNITGSLEVRVSKSHGESTLARIIAMVSDAQARKAATQSFLERLEGRYAIAVLGLVGLYIALAPLISGHSFSTTFYTAMVLLTVASPCALVISVPAALLSAIAGGARRGALFKGGAHLEALSSVKVIAFDKTGTLTYGRPAVTTITPVVGVSSEELLAIAARAELPSEHPIARAILARAQEQGLHVVEPEAFVAITAKGVRATWEGIETLVGTRRLLEEAGITATEGRESAETRPQTTLFIARGGRYLGHISIADQPREGVQERLAELRAAGIERFVMLTGDNEQVANALARQIGIDEVHAGLLPEEKLSTIEALRSRYGAVAMVGDGINDAPALAAATVGVAMGGAGTDAALESADLVLMSDDLGALVTAVRLSRRARRIVWQNIIFALAVALVLIVLTLSIGVPLPLGVVGHEGSTILVVLNGLRLLNKN